jgi:hypothetical protein
MLDPDKIKIKILQFSLFCLQDIVSTEKKLLAEMIPDPKTATKEGRKFFFCQ